MWFGYISISIVVASATGNLKRMVWQGFYRWPPLYKQDALRQRTFQRQKGPLLCNFRSTRKHLYTKRPRRWRNSSIAPSYELFTKLYGVYGVTSRLIAEVQGTGFTYKKPDAFFADLQEKLDDWERYLHSVDAVAPLVYPGWNNWNAHGVEKKA